MMIDVTLNASSQGIKKTVHAAFHDNTRKQILVALHEQGQDLAKQIRSNGDDLTVTTRFLSVNYMDALDFDSDYF